MIRSTLLEFASVFKCLAMEVHGTALVNNNLKLAFHNAGLSVEGMYMNMLKEMLRIRTKLSKLNLTDIEISILLAIVLFCQGRL